MPEENKQFTLPISVVSPTDVARLLRELDGLDEFLRQSTIRQGAEPEATPRYSRLLDELVVLNKVDLVHHEQRENLISDLKNIGSKAPVLHVSFSVDPPGPYVQKIVAWLRENIHKEILVRVGLQPNIGAGCVVRTVNKSFDFSLRKFFDNKHDFFMEKLHEVMVDREESVDEPEAKNSNPGENQPAEVKAQATEATS